MTEDGVVKEPAVMTAKVSAGTNWKRSAKGRRSSLRSEKGLMAKGAKDESAAAKGQGKTGVDGNF